MDSEPKFRGTVKFSWEQQKHYFHSEYNISFPATLDILLNKNKFTYDRSKFCTKVINFNTVN